MKDIVKAYRATMVWNTPAAPSKFKCKFQRSLPEEFRSFSGNINPVWYKNGVVYLSQPFSMSSGKHVRPRKDVFKLP